MKSKAILVSFIAFFAIAFALTTVAASENDLSNDLFRITDIEVDGVSAILDGVEQSLGITVSETVPVVVKFIAKDNGDDVRDEVTDVKVRAYVEGYKGDIEDETSRFHVLEGNTYTKKLSLKLPSSMDLDDLSESLKLLVRISAKGEDSLEVFFPLEIQKETYSLNLLSIDMEDVAVVGNTVSLEVVVENNGNERLDNVYVRASIPGLETSRKVYVGDLAPDADQFDDDINDAVSKKIYLTVPKTAAPGNYELEVEAYNYETSAVTKTRIVIDDVEANVVPTSTSKTIAPGKETSFDLVLVNPSDRMVLYTITPENSELIVEVAEPVVAVSADSSKTVKVNVKATESTKEGTYAVAVNVVSESGVAQKVSFSVSVEKDSQAVSKGRVTGSTIGGTNTTVVLTVVLIIVFVVLLIILIVLLTKKPAEQEEFGETNYY